MDFLPIFLNMASRQALVVGGGDVATRKVALLLEAGSRVTVVSPRFTEAMAQMAEDNRVTLIKNPFDESHLQQCDLVFAATNDAQINQKIATLATAAHIPVNVVDNPDSGSFIMPSIIDRSPVQIAISTGGASPVLARLLRSRLESTLPAAYGRLATLVERFREQVKGRFESVNQRRHFWEGVLQGEVAEQIFAGKEEQAEATLREAIETGDTLPAGEVYLVGGGPGDPDLLTFRALRLMQQADVIVHDRLISTEVLELTRRDAQRIYVGKERNHHSVPQDQINQLLVDLAKQGRRVCRLKGGDPFVFGRGGEEIETLAAHGVNFQVVPALPPLSAPPPMPVSP